MKKTTRLLLTIAALATVMLSVVYANSGFSFFTETEPVSLESATTLEVEFHQLDPTEEEIQALEAKLQELMN